MGCDWKICTTDDENKINNLEQPTEPDLMNNIQLIPALTGIRAVAVYFIFFKHLFFKKKELP